MKKKFIIYLIGNFGTKLLNIALVPIYSIYLLPQQLGIYDYWITLINLLSAIFSLQLFQSTYKELLYNKNKKEMKNNILGASIKIILIQIILILLLSLFLNLLNIEYIYYITTILILLILNEFINQGIARGLEKNIIMVISSFLLTLVVLVGTFILLRNRNYFPLDVIELMFIAQIIGLSVSIIVSCFLLKRINIFSNISFRNVPKDIYIKLLLFSLPLIPNTICWWVMNASDKVLISNFLGDYENGIYAMANKFPSILFIVNSIVSLIWQDEAITTSDNLNDDYYTKQLKLYIDIQFIVLILFIICFKFISRYFLSTDYLSAESLVPLLALSVGFSGISSFYGAFYLSNNDTKGTFITSFWGALINIIINLLFINVIGIYAAVISTLVSFTFMTILRIKRFSKSLNIIFPYRSFFIGSCLFAFIYIILYI